jgi:hypothetical protein
MPVMRRALIVGIDDYPDAPLAGCVNDAMDMQELLKCNDDDSPNFSCKLFTAPPLTTPATKITRSTLLKASAELFKDDAEVALLYFSGHGVMTELGGYLVTPDAHEYEEGVAMHDVLKLANESKAREVVIILDCCQSGAFANVPVLDNKTVLRPGISVLTASTDQQYAVELDGRGLFTSLVSDALSGGAADVIGDVTVASAYAYVEQMLGPWEQRPLFKANLSKLTSLRKCKPEVELAALRLLPRYFQTPDAVYPLDPSYEPELDPQHEEHQQIFGYFQKYRDARLLVPVGEKHLYHAALNSKACALTKLGKFYWRLVSEGLL